MEGKELSDEEMIEYYSAIARENGGEIISWYENAICFIFNEETSFEYQGLEISSDKFLISEKPCNKRLKGFPIDSLSKEIKSGKYHLEREKGFEDKGNMIEGFRKFFKKSLNTLS